jgi:hypothetical protein
MKIFFRLISAPVRRRDLRMAIPGLPHSGESLASRVAARHASAFVLESRSSLHAFQASSPCVTWVSNPLVLTRTSPAVADLDERPVGNSAPLNMASPTGFRMPSVPSQLWYADHADNAVALTACWFNDKYFAASSRSTMATWSSLLHPTMDLATSFTATCTKDSDSGVAAVNPGNLGLTTTGRQWAIFPMSKPLPSCRSSWPRGRCCASRATRPARNCDFLAREWRYGFTVNCLSNVTPRRSKLPPGLTSAPSTSMVKVGGGASPCRRPSPAFSPR